MISLAYFGTLVNRIRGKSRPVEKWYDMGDVNLAKTFKKPCLKDIKTAGENVKTEAENDEKDEHQTDFSFQRVHVSSSEKNHQTQKKKKLDKVEQQNRPKKPLSAVDLYHLLTSTLKKPTKRTTTTTTSRQDVISTTTTTSFVRIFSTSSTYHHRPTEIITTTQVPFQSSQKPTDFFIRIFSTPSTIYFGKTLTTTTTTTTTKPPSVAQTQKKHFHIVDSHVNTIEIVDIDSPRVDTSQPRPGDIEIVGDSDSDSEGGGVYVYVDTYSCAPTHCQRKVPYKQFNNRVLQHRNIYP